MTVNELREKLAALPDSAILLVEINDGYGLVKCAAPHIAEEWERKSAHRLAPHERSGQLVVLGPSE